ncbi:MAG TPA: prenyltransferase/squalene oxidase repeat-containing protein [Planctomycetota bacterium]|nr:prenyltransferase/squalene oxidase repeat-containing protein [Planctomycetota bacterium]
MRSIAHPPARGFDETVQELVRGSPWWLISLVLHGIALAILWAIPTAIEVKEQGAHIVCAAPTEMKEVEQINLDPPPVQPPEDIEKKPVEIEDVADVPQDDTEDDFHEVSGEEGPTSGVYSGPSTESVVGLGSGGGGHGRGSRRHTGATGSDARTQDAVDAALKWLAEHQDMDADGRWDADDFMKHDPADDRCDGAGGALHDVGVTGLAVLAFLGADYTDRGNHPFAKHVREGLRYLIRSQEPDGCFGSRASHSFMYSHAIATLAMCEAFWMTRNPRYRKPAQDGINFISAARNPYLAWRYEPRGGQNDTSVTGWCVMAMKSGKYAGLEVDPDAFDGARAWIEKMTEPNFGQVGYDSPGGAPARPEGKQDRFPCEKSQSMTAVGVLTRIFLGEDPRTSDMIRKGAKLCVEHPPRWNPDDGSIDMYYWYYGTLAIFQVGGAPWKTWNDAMVGAIVNHQHGKGTGSREGSWDPVGCWGDDGGRVYSTAMLAMCLEVYYRYPKVFGAADTVRK